MLGDGRRLGEMLCWYYRVFDSTSGLYSLDGSGTPTQCDKQHVFRHCQLSCLWLWTTALNTQFRKCLTIEHPYLTGVVCIFTLKAQHIKGGKQVGDYLDKFAHLWMRNPQSRGMPELLQEPGVSMHKLFFISLPHLFSRIFPACVPSQVCFTLYQKMLKKQMAWLLVACNRINDKMWWDPWGSFTNKQVQTEQINGSQRDSYKPASEKDSSVS